MVQKIVYLEADKQPAFIRLNREFLGRWRISLTASICCGNCSNLKVNLGFQNFIFLR